MEVVFGGNENQTKTTTRNSILGQVCVCVSQQSRIGMSSEKAHVDTIRPDRRMHFVSSLSLFSHAMRM